MEVGREWFKFQKANDLRWVGKMWMWCSWAFSVLAQKLKGHRTTSASSPDFFQKSWDFYTIRSVYLCNDCMLYLTGSFNLVTKIIYFSCSSHFQKSTFKKWPTLSWLLNLNLVPSNIILEWRKILKLVCADLEYIQKQKKHWKLFKLWHFDLT